MSDKFYKDEDNIWCLKPTAYIGNKSDKHEIFKRHFRELLHMEWDPNDCTPIEFRRLKVGVNKCLCSQDINNCLCIQHSPTGIIFQVGCICWDDKTKKKDRKVINKLKKEFKSREVAKELLVKQQLQLIAERERKGYLIVDIEEDNDYQYVEEKVKCLIVDDDD